MKAILLVLSLLASSSAFAQFTEAPEVPATAPNPAYPLRIHIYVNHFGRHNGEYEGYGRADLLGPPPQGFDYTYTCGEPFLHNAQPEEFYQAKWKKPNQKLEILLLRVGSNHEQKCDLNISLKPEPYGRPRAAAPPPPAP